MEKRHPWWGLCRPSDTPAPLGLPFWLRLFAVSVEQGPQFVVVEKAPTGFFGVRAVPCACDVCEMNSPSRFVTHHAATSFYLLAADNMPLHKLWPEQQSDVPAPGQPRSDVGTQLLHTLGQQARP